MSTSPCVVIATPGRLWELCERRVPGLATLAWLDALVVDEADKLMEPGKFQELLKVLDRIYQEEVTAGRWELQNESDKEEAAR